MTTDAPDVAQVLCRLPGCRFRSIRAGYAARWADWSQHYLAAHYDARWSAPCPLESCSWSTPLSATPSDHQRALVEHARSHEVPA